MSVFENKLFVINKHRGPTSFDVVAAFRRAIGIKKVGHAGTLDPLAQGVLLLCVGRATRAVEHFMNLNKTYEFTVHLGVGTTTLDAEGTIVREVPCPKLVESQIIDATRRFVGHYQLDPPAYSAVKHNGRRLYELARAGDTPVVKSRLVVIHQLQVTRIALPEVCFSIKCSRGTYVRSIARDFGAIFDLPAHISRLVRTSVGPFRVEDAFCSENIFAGDVAGLRGLRLREALDFLPAIVLKETFRRYLVDGALPQNEDVVETIGAVAESSALRILDETGELLAIGNRALDDVAGGPSVVNSFRLFVDRGSTVR